ncbi:MAG: hydrogenase nickel incorporation protein HypB [Fidelibacterota bacterium]|nr:MAG: hydrogenase nickel incorporation protein HypB [Candidatus Neomarinimicrobiota bacterium]
MCETCGCGQPDNQGVKILKPGASDPHTHDGQGHTHDHPHHHHDHPHTETIQVQEDILSANNLVAARNRGYFEGRGIFALNLMSSPGAGKTTLLERTIRDLSPDLPWAVIEGDQQTTVDADRIDAVGAEAVQVNTGTGCHLDALMVREAMAQLSVPEGAVLAIENVGNLVCPALFDLGEARRVVIVSTTEGSDKPLKYPTILRDAHLCIINKLDLLPYVDFDQDEFMTNARRINPDLGFIPLSAKTGEGLEGWYDWVRENHKAANVDSQSANDQ